MTKYRAHSYSPDPSPKLEAFWCPNCRILVRQKIDPIECVQCGGDMALPPKRMWDHDAT